MDDVTAVAVAEKLKMHRKEVSVYLYRLVDYGQVHRAAKRGHSQHNPPKGVETCVVSTGKTTQQLYLARGEVVGCVVFTNKPR